MNVGSIANLLWRRISSPDTWGDSGESGEACEFSCCVLLARFLSISSEICRFLSVRQIWQIPSVPGSTGYEWGQDGFRSKELEGDTAADEVELDELPIEETGATISAIDEPADEEGISIWVEDKEGALEIWLIESETEVENDDACKVEEVPSDAYWTPCIPLAYNEGEEDEEGA